jgi:hypothetical protein
MRISTVDGGRDDDGLELRYATLEIMSAVRRPVTVDTALAKLHGQKAQVAIRRTRASDSIHYALGEHKAFISHRISDWPTSASAAATALQAKLDAGGVPSYHAEHVRSSLSGWRLAGVELAAIGAQIKPLNDEFARTRWSRFFLVTNAGGHVHSSMGCPTCHPTTDFVWLPALSGLTEADAVAAQGPRLCTVCFPSAPTEWTSGSVRPADPDLCPGSGKGVHLERHRTFCSVCAKSVKATTIGTAPKHKGSVNVSIPKQ